MLGVAVLGNFVFSLYIDIHLKTGYNYLLLMYESLPKRDNVLERL